MSKRQQVAAVLLDPAKALLPEYADFKALVKEAILNCNYDEDMIDRMHAAIPQ